MRNKIKQLMNKEEGFTLVELLAVIVILGIILAIAIPSIGNVIDRANSGADEAEAGLVEDAARLYVTTVAEDDDWTDNSLTVSAEQLRDAGLLDDRSGTTDDENIPTGSVAVERTETETDSGNYNYTYTYSE